MPEMPVTAAGAEAGRQTTRDRIVALLRRHPRTVEELARLVGLTDNGVRMHLVALEQAGTVRPSGVRRTGMAGKPATIFEITPEAEVQFSKAYAPVLAELVTVLAANLPRAQIVEVMRQTGQRLAAGTALSGELEKRLRAAVEMLNDLGAMASVEASESGFRVEGTGCPLSAAVARCPETCTAVEALLAELTGAVVKQECDHGDRPACRFTVAPAD